MQGPLARTVKDVRLGLHAMSARDPRDPWWVPAQHHGRSPQRPIKVGLVTDIALVSGVVLGAAGVYFLLAGGDDKADKASVKVGKSARASTHGPRIEARPAGAGVEVVGTF